MSKTNIDGHPKPLLCEDYVAHTELAVNYFRAYVNPVITVIGVFGNILALYLFGTQRPWNRFSIYAMALAISDSLVLISNTFLDDFLGRGLYFLTDQKYMIKLDTYSVEVCRFMEVIGSWFVFTSGCLLVAFSLDRVACLFRPLQCRSNGGIRIAFALSVMIMILGLILSLPHAILLNLVTKEEVVPEGTSFHGAYAERVLSIGSASMLSSFYSPNISSNGSHNIKVTSSCTLDTGRNMRSSEFVPFIFSTMLTYMMPCVVLVLTNFLISWKLIKLKRKRHSLCNREKTNNHLQRWASQRSSSIGEPRESTVLHPTVASMVQRNKSNVLGNRKEMYRVVALLILSCCYLLFTFPVSVALSIRAALTVNDSDCKLIFYEHFTRLLTSIKDVNYALNGYVYTLFFSFYRGRLLHLITCGRVRYATKAGARSLSTTLAPADQTKLNTFLGRNNTVMHLPVSSE
ncbi:putative g-protein coupled receptor [Fasciola gigantica]|uniref:Putative g-protein coupled receptor n=1 Tax=Fasciola gigantica TaxID=46835 RepID=A0A504YRR5_FASGI|nr:putative g-protein coupled receptor [Fasciola gigantica]